MADVVFVCVREDVAYAEALAERFDADGFAVGERVSDPSAICVLVWSSEASQSRAFHRAATRAIVAGQALVACVGPTPAPPQGIDATCVFDLLHWDGDPAAAALAPLCDAAAETRRADQTQPPQATQGVWSGARAMGGASLEAHWGIAAWTQLADAELATAPATVAASTPIAASQASAKPRHKPARI